MDAVEWVAEEFQARTGTKVHLTLPKVDLAIDRERSTALFRILQEALTNVARHANATQVSVRLAEEDGVLILVIQDNGQGISAERLSASDSLGILGMRERSCAARRRAHRQRRSSIRYNSDRPASGGLSEIAVRRLVKSDCTRV